MAKTKRILAYIVLGLFSLMAFAVGIPKIFALQGMVDVLAPLGYGGLFVRFLGLCWLLAGVGVWYKKARSLAALLIIPIMSGAIAAHWTKGDGFLPPLLVPIILALLILYFDGFYKRINP